MKFSSSRRGLYFYPLDGSTGAKLVYQTNSVIDSLSLDVSGHRLYWPDSLNGTVSSLDIESRDQRRIQTLVTNLSRPRAVHIDANNR